MGQRFDKIEKDINDLALSTKAGFDETTQRFDKIDQQQTYLQRQVDAGVTHAGELKKEIRKRPTKKEFNGLKKRVTALEQALV